MSAGRTKPWPLVTMTACKGPNETCSNLANITMYISMVNSKIVMDST